MAQIRDVEPTYNISCEEAIAGYPQTRMEWLLDPKQEGLPSLRLAIESLKGAPFSESDQERIKQCVEIGGFLPGEHEADSHYGGYIVVYTHPDQQRAEEVVILSRRETQGNIRGGHGEYVDLQVMGSRRNDDLLTAAVVFGERQEDEGKTVYRIRYIRSSGNLRCRQEHNPRLYNEVEEQIKNLLPKGFSPRGYDTYGQTEQFEITQPEYQQPVEVKISLDENLNPQERTSNYQGFEITLPAARVRIHSATLGTRVLQIEAQTGPINKDNYWDTAPIYFSDGRTEFMREE